MSGERELERLSDTSAADSRKPSIRGGLRGVSEEDFSRIDKERRERNILRISLTTFLSSFGLLTLVLLSPQMEIVRLITLSAVVLSGLLYGAARLGYHRFASLGLVILILAACTLAVHFSREIGPSPFYVALAILIAVATMTPRGVLLTGVLGALSLGAMTLSTWGVLQPPLPSGIIVINAAAVFVITAVVALLQARGIERSVAQAAEAQRKQRLAIEEQNLLFEQLQQSQKMEALGRLAGGIAHDFNNLLLVIQASSEYARTLTENSDLNVELEQVERAAERGANLTKSLLAFARRQVVEREDVELHSLIEAIAPLLKSMVGASVQLELEVLTPSVACCSKVQIEQVLMNLAANARDAMPDGGKVLLGLSTLSASHSKKRGLPSMPHALIKIEDTGTGIPAEALPRIFEPFYSTKKGIGTGLGLATCHGIVKQLGGRIDVESTAGKGTCFRVAIPLSALIEDEEAVRARAKAGAEADATVFADLALGTLLVVEDEEVSRGLIARQLEPYCRTVRVAGSAEAALSLVEEIGEEIDCVLSDIVLGPGLTGVELTEMLVRKLPRAAFCLMSGYVGDSEGVSSQLMQRLSFLPKPFTRERALDALRTAQNKRDLALNGSS